MGGLDFLGFYWVLLGDSMISFCGTDDHILNWHHCHVFIDGKCWQPELLIKFDETHGEFPSNLMIFLMW